MRRSYVSATAAVMPVRMMPGRTSNTAMPSGASRTASPLLHIASPALEMQ